MITQFVEVTDGLACGKFLVARMTREELATKSAMPEAQEWGAPLLSYAGRRRFNDHSTLVIDLQRGTGAAWPLQGGEVGMEHYSAAKLAGLRPLVCPLYFTFVRWLHERGEWPMGRGDITTIPRYLDLREIADDDTG